MTEQDKKELIELGFRDHNSYLSITMNNRNKDSISMEINKYGIIKIDNWDVGMIVGKFESVAQIRRKIEGLKILIS